MGKKPDWPWSIPSYQFSSIWLVRVMISPSLNPSSPSFSGSKSYRARQHGWSMWTPMEKKHKEKMCLKISTVQYPFYHCTYYRLCCFWCHSYADDSSLITSKFGLLNFIRRQLSAFGRPSVFICDCQYMSENPKRTKLQSSPHQKSMGTISLEHNFYQFTKF